MKTKLSKRESKISVIHIILGSGTGLIASPLAMRICLDMKQPFQHTFNELYWSSIITGFILIVAGLIWLRRYLKNNMEK